MALLVEQQKTIRPEYYNLAKIPDCVVAQNRLSAIAQFGRLVNLCAQAIERSHIQVYENGDVPYVPADKPAKRYFTFNPITSKRIEEIDEALIREVPMHIPTKDGQSMILVRPVMFQTAKGERRQFFYAPVDKNGQVIKEDGKPKRIEVEPSQVVAEKTINIITGEEVKAYTEREILREEIEGLVAFHFKDLIENPSAEKTADEWINAHEIVPALIGFMTDKDSYIEGVQKSHTLNIVSSAMQIARNPNTKIKIVAGFGAFDGEPSNCYAGNALPALEMAEKIRAFFEQRQAANKRGLTHPPVVELVFAQEAGIQANFTDQAEAVRGKMAGNIALVEKFTNDLYPKVPVVFNRDIPWQNLTPETLAVIRYYANLITNSPSASIKETLADLVASGHTKGTTSSTEETAAQYSGIHPFVWGLKPEYVPTQYLFKEVPADIVIRVGPRTEAKFDAMIMTIQRTESKEGFIDHVLQQGLTPKVAEQIVNSAESFQPDQTPTMILETGRIGEHGPTYFSYSYDLPADHPLEHSLKSLQAKMDQVEYQLDNGGNLSKADLLSLTTMRTVLTARVYDLKAIARAWKTRYNTSRLDDQAVQALWETSFGDPNRFKKLMQATLNGPTLGEFLSMPERTPLVDITHANGTAI